MSTIKRTAISPQLNRFQRSKTRILELFNYSYSEKTRKNSIKTMHTKLSYVSKIKIKQTEDN